MGSSTWQLPLARRYLFSQSIDMRIIVTGLMAQHPLGGLTWHYAQYAAGLARLGHDVYYVEDTGMWPYALDGGATGSDFIVADCCANARYLSAAMQRFGLADKWAYNCPIDNRWFGLSDIDRCEATQTADLLISVSAPVFHPDEYRRIAHRAFIDTDPVFTQIKLVRGQADFRAALDVYDVHFSFGESLSAPVPLTGHVWRPTRQPVLLYEWRPFRPTRGVFTTVMNWDSYNPVKFQQMTYGQKDVEFMRCLDLPSRVTPERLEVAARVRRHVHLPDSVLSHLRFKGWQVVDPNIVCPDVDSYRDYIESSKAEWGVAKNGYVVGQPGWFSDRSACYLAAGRPVVVQDTGFTSIVPAGEGVLTFRTLDEAAEQIRDVAGNYDRHCRAARAIAEEYFNSDVVLSRLVQEATSSSVGDPQPEARSDPRSDPASGQPGRSSRVDDTFQA